MTIQLHNTLTRRKEPLTPLTPGRVGLYVCGVTVYDYCHIGHARVMVAFDVIVRHLRARGYTVTYVRNFTDIDDKIIKRAGELGVPIQEVTEKFITAFQEDMASLGVIPADVEPRATEHLAEMQELITRLLEHGLAYESGGDIYYSVSRFPFYGRLSGKSLSDLAAGARVAVDERKENPLDFVLWKAAKPGEPQWPSPWGPGRPGWHIECSAMSMKYLGESFDIHGGGQDLIFPHHENEIAQSQGATGKPWVGIWLHNGFVNVESADGEREKMSKSLGNFHTIRDLLTHFPGEALRFFILNSHYRSPLDFGFNHVQAARHALDRFYGTLDGVRTRLGRMTPALGVDAALAPTLAAERERFLAAMDDDANTPQAVAVLFDVARRVNQAMAEADEGEMVASVGLLRELGGLLGLFQEEPEAWLQHGVELGNAEIEALIAARNAARKARNFAESDRIRDELAAKGIQLLDSREGTAWRRGH